MRPGQADQWKVKHSLIYKWHDREQGKYVPYSIDKMMDAVITLLNKTEIPPWIDPAQPHLLPAACGAR